MNARYWVGLPFKERIVETTQFNSRPIPWSQLNQLQNLYLIQLAILYNFISYYQMQANQIIISPLLCTPCFCLGKGIAENAHGRPQEMQKRAPTKGCATDLHRITCRLSLIWIRRAVRRVQNWEGQIGLRGKWYCWNHYFFSCCYLQSCH